MTLPLPFCITAAEHPIATIAIVAAVTVAILFVAIKRVLKFLTGIPAISGDELTEALVKSHIMRIWQSLEKPAPERVRVALYGAGKHTRWLESVILSFPPRRIDVVAVLDDNAQEHGQRVWGQVPIRPSQLAADEVDLVILSSDTTLKETMRTHARELWSTQLPLIDLYEGLPLGPYPKKHL